MTPEHAAQLVSRVAPRLSAEAASSLTRALYLPVSSLLSARAREATRARSPRTFVASIGGLPGTGKSTLALVLEALLEADHALVVARFSLDDLYLSGSARARLAATIHPLFAQRGPPGTHDVALGLAVAERLRNAAPDARTALPRFDKLADEPYPEGEWPVFVGRPDVLLLDGWFWGREASASPSLDPPLNERERTEDPDGTWRRAVQAALAVGYPELFSLSEFHVQLEAPSHAASVRWRTLQGQDLLRQRGLDPKSLDPKEIARFLELFERVGQLPRRPSEGVHVLLDDAHLVHAMSRVALAT